MNSRISAFATYPDSAAKSAARVRYASQPCAPESIGRLRYSQPRPWSHPLTLFQSSSSAAISD
jgi:hypothetical protein